MSLLDTKYKRKSAALTAVIAILILMLIFIFGLTYYDPPKEYGIAVNFGTSDVGSGDIQPKEALRPAEQNSEEEVIEEEVVEEEVKTEEVVSEQTEAKPVSESNEISEDVLTQNNEEAIAIKKEEEAKRKQNELRKIEEEKKKIEADKKLEEERKAEEERKKIVAEKKRIEKEKKEKAAKRRSLDALVGGFGKTDGKATGGEGDDKQQGDKGKVTGDPNASGYYGNGGGGNGGNYQLGNRKALSKPKPMYDCNEEGKVFVSISVDNFGNVISAQPGVKGTTNSASCLLTRAKEAALKTKFNPDSNAPSKQIGIIIYNFSLSN